MKTCWKLGKEVSMFNLPITENNLSVFRHYNMMVMCCAMMLTYKKNMHSCNSRSQSVEDTNNVYNCVLTSNCSKALANILAQDAECLTFAYQNL